MTSMVRRRARFHADEARFSIAEELNDFRAAQPTLDDDPSGSVDPVNLKPVLGEIETDCDSLHDGRLLSVVAFTDDHVVAHRCRGAGAVHPIKIFARLRQAGKSTALSVQKSSAELNDFRRFVHIGEMSGGFLCRERR